MNIKSLKAIRPALFAGVLAVLLAQVTPVAAVAGQSNPPPQAVSNSNSKSTPAAPSSATTSGGYGTTGQTSDGLPKNSTGDLPQSSDSDSKGYIPPPAGSVQCGLDDSPCR